MTTLMLCWFCFSDLSEYLDSKTVVISFFGMSQYHKKSSKVGLVDEMLGYQVFKSSVVDDPEVDPETLVNLL